MRRFLACFALVALVTTLVVLPAQAMPTQGLRWESVGLWTWLLPLVLPSFMKSGVVIDEDGVIRVIPSFRDGGAGSPPLIETGAAIDEDGVS